MPLHGKLLCYFFRVITGAEYKGLQTFVWVVEQEQGEWIALHALSYELEVEGEKKK